MTVTSGHDRSSRRPVSLTPGTRIGPYEIVSPIGSGGMGDVYRGVDEPGTRSGPR